MTQFWSVDECNQKEASNVRCMYRKQDVYMGVKECSFEEMKAQKWQREVDRKQARDRALAKVCTPKQKRLDEDEIIKKVEGVWLKAIQDNQSQDQTDLGESNY